MRQSRRGQSERIARCDGASSKGRHPSSLFRYSPYRDDAYQLWTALDLQLRQPVLFGTLAVRNSYP